MLKLGPDMPCAPAKRTRQANKPAVAARPLDRATATLGTRLLMVCLAGSVGCSYGIAGSSVSRALEDKAESDPELRGDIETILAAPNDAATDEVARCVRSTLDAESIERAIASGYSAVINGATPQHQFDSAKKGCLGSCPIRAQAPDTPDQLRDIAARWTTRCEQQFSDLAMANKQQESRAEIARDAIETARESLSQGNRSLALEALTYAERLLEPPEYPRPKVQTTPSPLMLSLREEIAVLRRDPAIQAESALLSDPAVIELLDRADRLRLQRRLVAEQHNREENRRMSGCAADDICSYDLEAQLDRELDRLDAQLLRIRTEIDGLRSQAAAGATP